jgi:hypothetical protein
VRACLGGSLLRILGSEDRSFVFFGLVLPVRRRSSVVRLLALLRSPSNNDDDEEHDHDDSDDSVASDATDTQHNNDIGIRHHEARHHEWANDNGVDSASNCTDDTNDLPHPMNAVSQATQRSRSHHKSQRANADSVDPTFSPEEDELPTHRPSETGSDSDSPSFGTVDPEDPTHENYEKQQAFGSASHPPVTSPPKVNRGPPPYPNPAETRPASPPRESIMQIHKRLYDQYRPTEENVAAHDAFHDSTNDDNRGAFQRKMFLEDGTPPTQQSNQPAIKPEWKTVKSLNGRSATEAIMRLKQLSKTKPTPPRSATKTNSKARTARPKPVVPASNN